MGFLRFDRSRSVKIFCFILMFNLFEYFFLFYLEDLDLSRDRADSSDPDTDLERDLDCDLDRLGDFSSISKIDLSGSISIISLKN